MCNDFSLSNASLLTDYLTAIATKACPLSERLSFLVSNGTPSQSDPEVSSEIERRLEFWCQVVAKGDWEKFERRLLWDELDIKTARLLLGEPVPTASALPLWTQTLKQVIESAQRSPVQPLKVPHRALKAERPIPFEDLFLPCLDVAQTLLEKRLGGQFDAYHRMLATDAQVALEHNLIESLAYVFAPTLMQQFSASRTSGNALRDYLIISLQGSNKREKYQAFINAQLQDGLLHLFEQYSALGRLAVTIIEFWAESTAELVNRLQVDWATLEQTFSPNHPLSQVKALQVGLSDDHNRGRSVAILTFDTKLKLVYKPKDLALEIAFGNLLHWCSQAEDLLDFKVPHVLNCSTHGWASFIPVDSCDTPEALQRFYRRSGMLMCLIHTLEGTDCHYENLIANGEYPVLVDMETLFHPQIKPSELLQMDATTQLVQQLSNSVLRTALLPQKELSIASDQIRLDMSGLGAVQDHTIPSLRWQHINTDGMVLDYEDINISTEANVPTLHDVSASSGDFVDEIVDGFEQMYRWLMSQRTQLLAADSLLRAFANQECRLVFRNTRTYASILAHSYDSQLLQAGVARSVGLDVLSRAYLITPRKPQYWSILAAEQQAMEQLDIPLLTANTSSKDLVLPTGTVIVDLFEESSFDRVISRVQSLSKADLAFQRQVIQLSLYSRFCQEPDLDGASTAPLVFSDNGAADPASVSTASVSTNAAIDTAAIASPQELIDEAIAIAKILEQQAIVAEDGTIGWLGIGYQHSSQSFHIQGLGINLYDGSSGVALFLAALARITGETHWQQLSRTLLKPLHAMFANLAPDNGDRLIKLLGIGGATGMGSLLYALSHLSQWLDDPTLLQLALQATALITPERIADDRRFDVVGGSAGCLLGLLSLAERVGESDRAQLVELATVCGQHLLNQQTGTDGTPRAWTTWREQQLSGFSQGAAGIAYALLRLFAVTHDARFLDAATEAIAYEQTLFSAECQNWADLRSSEPLFRVSWAQGAPGIALARLGGLAILDTEAIRQQIAIALNTTQQALVWGLDSVCWGTLGRIEPLLLAAQVLDQPDLLTTARQASKKVLTTAQTQGLFHVFERGSPDMINPGFFHGLSGIGYALLRIAHPHQLPSILLLE